MKAYRIESILLEVLAGENVEQQKRLACYAALEHDCTVEFVHNNRLFRVNRDDLMRCVFEQEKST